VKFEYEDDEDKTLTRGNAAAKNNFVSAVHSFEFKIKNRQFL